MPREAVVTIDRTKYIPRAVLPLLDALIPHPTQDGADTLQLELDLVMEPSAPGRREAS
jgi:hypothetical protein